MAGGQGNALQGGRTRVLIAAPRARSKPACEEAWAGSRSTPFHRRARSPFLLFSTNGGTNLVGACQRSVRPTSNGRSIAGLVENELDAPHEREGRVCKIHPRK